jgi:hypothetical protein
MADVAKLEAVLDYIRMHPEEHHQDYWARRTDRGTTLCFAGTAVVLAGYQLDWTYGPDTTERCVTSAGGPLSLARAAFISVVAARELGLTPEQAAALFSPADNLDDLERIVKDIANEAA